MTTNELGSFYRVVMKSGDEYDFNEHEGIAIISAYTKYKEYFFGQGDAIMPYICFADNIGVVTYIDLDSIAAIRLSTPKTREACRQRDKLFATENESSKTWD